MISLIQHGANLSTDSKPDVHSLWSTVWAPMQGAAELLSMQMPSKSRLEPASSNGSLNFRIKVARFFVSAAVVVILLDTIPPTWPWFTQPKLWLSHVLNRVGLWQGQWTMFAPDPILENALLSVDFEIKDQKSDSWDSPNWKQVGTLEKFYRFRHMNFYNRLHLDHNKLALNDFLDYLAIHRSNSPVVKLKVYRNAMTLLPSEDGSILDRQEWIWVSRSDFLSERRYEP